MSKNSLRFGGKEKIGSKKLKKNYFSKSTWLKLNYYKQYGLITPVMCFFFSRSSQIPLNFVSKTIFIHTGKTWNPRLVRKWMVGFRPGNFTWNRKIAFFKKKQLKKKK